MKFSIIHPSRHRPAFCFDTMEKWFAMAENNDIEYIISLDYDDETLPYYKNEFLDHNKDIKMVYMKNKSAVDAINYAASLTTGDIIIVLSDDFNEPLPNWDRQVLDFIDGRTDWILKTQDGAQPWIITLPIMDREFYNRFGYIYYPEYLHMFSDTDLTSVADYLGKKLTCDLFFKHNHYTVTGKWDKVTVKADSTYPQGGELYKRRFFEDFDVQNPVGHITEPSHLQWMRANGCVK